MRNAVETRSRPTIRLVDQLGRLLHEKGASPEADKGYQNGASMSCGYHGPFAHVQRGVAARREHGGNNFGGPRWRAYQRPSWESP